MATYYQILGVNSTATAAQIKKQFRVLAKQYHPDVNPNGAAKFREINNAYTVLSNPASRRTYDAQLYRPFTTTYSRPTASATAAPTEKKHRDHKYRTHSKARQDHKGKTTKHYPAKPPKNLILNWLFVASHNYPIVLSLSVVALLVYFFGFYPNAFVCFVVLVLPVLVGIRMFRNIPNRKQ